MKIITRYLIALFVIAAIVLLLMDKLVMPIYVNKAKERTLPDVIGKPVSEAQEILKGKGFGYVIAGEKDSDMYLPGTVIAQFPEALTKVKIGRRIKLTIASEGLPVLVPDLRGSSLRKAKLMLEELGLQIDTVQSEYDLTLPKDIVKNQTPLPDEKVNKGTSVTLVISLGKPENVYIVPDVVGKSFKKAQSLLSKANLKVGKVTYRQDEDLLRYTVLEQSIVDSTILDHPAEIDLVISIIDLEDIRRNLMEKE